MEMDIWNPDCWTHVQSPDEDDFAFLSEQLGVPRDFLTDCTDVDERPRLEVDGGWTLTIIRIPVHTPDTDVPYRTMPVGIITGSDTVVTVSHADTGLFDDFLDRLRHKGIDRPGHTDFILHLIDAATYRYLCYLRRINNDVEAAEKQLEKSVRNSDLLWMMGVEKSLVFFNTSLRGNAVLIARIRHAYGNAVDADLVEDVEIEMRQALDTVSIYSDILEASMDAFASIVSNNVNAIMKRMTGVTIVLMIPTLIASFYGMNVDVGIAGFPWAFWAVAAFAALLTAGTYFVLKRIGWF